MTKLPTAAGAVFALCLSGCSRQPAEPADPVPAGIQESAPQTTAQTPQPAAPSLDLEAAPASANVLTREGLGALMIGETVPAGSGWAERGAQIPGPCRTVSSPEFPGVYAIVEGGKVRRITIGERSSLKLAQGIVIGTGASEAEVRTAIPSLREEPHKYVESPGKYLTSPSMAGGEPALRFEIDRDGKVSLVHIGTMPALGYVEGCG